MNCKNCGERMVGDGYYTVMHCPNAEDSDYDYMESDASPVYCTTDYDEAQED